MSHSGLKHEKKRYWIKFQPRKTLRKNRLVVRPPFTFGDKVFQFTELHFPENFGSRKIDLKIMNFCLKIGNFRLKLSATLKMSENKGI